MTSSSIAPYRLLGHRVVRRSEHRLVLWICWGVRHAAVLREKLHTVSSYPIMLSYAPALVQYSVPYAPTLSCYGMILLYFATGGGGKKKGRGLKLRQATPPRARAAPPPHPPSGL
eukprot:2927091-Rhodomonas_salina.3